MINLQVTCVNVCQWSYNLPSPYAGHMSHTGMRQQVLCMHTILGRHGLTTTYTMQRVSACSWLIQNLPITFSKYPSVIANFFIHRHTLAERLLGRCHLLFFLSFGKFTKKWESNMADRPRHRVPLNYYFFFFASHWLGPLSCLWDRQNLASVNVEARNPKWILRVHGYQWETLE